MLTLDELESHLWEAANILRGSPVGPHRLEKLSCPLLFFKRICDVWTREHAAVESYGETLPKIIASRYRKAAIGSACETPVNVGMALAERHARYRGRQPEASVNMRLGDAQWTNKERLPDPLRPDLIESISALNLGNQRIIRT